jgi:hypothetical protein
MRTFTRLAAALAVARAHAAEAPLWFTQHGRLLGENTCR